MHEQESARTSHVAVTVPCVCSGRHFHKMSRGSVVFPQLSCVFLQPRVSHDPKTTELALKARYFQSPTIITSCFPQPSHTASNLLSIYFAATIRTLALLERLKLITSWSRSHVDSIPAAPHHGRSHGICHADQGTSRIAA
jgi:hypothetical protein